MAQQYTDEKARINGQALLSVKNLTIDFKSEGRIVRAVDGVSFKVDRGKTLCVVGESGCGKSVTSLAIMGLLPTPPAIIAGDEVNLGDTDLLALGPAAMRRVRGDRIAMIFQEPMTSLDPVYTIGDQIVEAIKAHENISTEKAMERALELLKRVRIPEPNERLRQYPHNLSGGMRQRVMIAIALACNPELLIADEPTTALDVTIQAQILDLITQLKDQLGMALMLITHDLGVVAQVADEVVVMYAGQVVEKAPAEGLFDTPQHPYTLGLLGSIPRVDEQRPELATIKGRVPPPFDMPKGCRFHPRCPFAQEKCLQQPELALVGQDHWAACWRSPLEQHILGWQPTDCEARAPGGTSPDSLGD
ncbi:MAG: ABC transporter ATP-binding protein [Deltaproteobacteria bacterium]|nr:ABC transporter ATP-binding protein [Deltaproteobacteria bacterium]